MILNSAGQASNAGASAAMIKDGDTMTFNDDVIHASMDVPVIVDFWATWCQPCKQLTPILERIVQQARGRVRLVKIDIDKNQELAMQLRIKSVPTVYAFHGGRPVDAFVGGQPESTVKQFVDRLLQGVPSPVADVLKQGQDALDAGDPLTAGELFSHVLEEDPTNTKAIAGLIRARVAVGDPAGAREMIGDLPADITGNADVKAAIQAIELAEQTLELGDLADLQRRIAADPLDQAAKLDLAMALYGGGRSEAAVDTLLEMIRQDRAWNDEAARKQLIKMFDALGSTHPLTVSARRRLSSLLFS